MILTRYIGKDILVSTLAITLILLLVIVSGRFVGFMADAAAGEIPAELLRYLLIYTMPGLFQLVLPLGFFIAVMLVYGQLYVDSEMIVMQACGLGQVRLLKTAMIPGLLIAAVVAYCSLVVAPAGESLLRKEMEKPSSTAGFSTLVAGKFQYLGSGVTVYVQSLNDDKTEMRDVFLIQEQHDEGVHQQIIVRAQRGYIEYRFDNVRYLVLAEGTQFQLERGSLERSQIGFTTFALRLPDSTTRDLKPASVDVLPTQDLLFSSDPEQIAALQWRVSMPLMVMIMGVIGFSLSRTTHRKGRYGKLLPGVLLFFFYFTALSLLRDAIEDGKANPQVGMWWVHGVMALIALAVFNGENAKERLFAIVRRR